ncbi:MAG: LysM peptidoglycan-binding domain-containing protein [Vicinamibacteria bacterium]
MPDIKKPADDEMPDFSGVTGGASTTAKSAAPAVVFETYKVQPGDSLSKIAKHKYGNANLWNTIYEANKDRIKNPDLIQVGWELKIPAKPE